MTPMFECNLPPYLAHDLEVITHEQAQYLRDKYLWGNATRWTGNGGHTS